MNYRHGHARKFGTSTYHVWMGMRQRCGNPRNDSYARYGGRGIRVCERWQVFDAFLADMGEKPPDLSIDRINNEGNYEPGNCHWATRSEQMLNRRPFCEQGRKNIAKSQAGKRASLETRARMSESGRRAWVLRKARNLCSHS